MKRILCTILSVLFVFLLTGCGKTTDTQIDVGESELFTQDDRSAAVDLIVQRIDDSDAIKKLYSVRYAGDEESKAETEGYRDTPLAHDEIIVFKIAFRSADSAHSGGFNPNEIYTDFSYMLGRNAGGAWEFVTAGYA